MSLFITHVESGFKGHFLRIFGQTSKDEAIKIEQAIAQVVTQPKHFHPKEVQTGLRCLTRYEDGQYYRAKIVRVLEHDLVSVNFIDYGNTATVHISELLSLHTKSPQTIYLMGTAPQANEYILARICGPWSQEQMMSIRMEICNESHTYHLEDKVDRIPIIGVLHMNFDYSQYLIENRQLGVFVSVKNQKESLAAGKLVTSPPHAVKVTPEKISNLANMRYLQTSSVVKKNLEPKPISTNPFLPQSTVASTQQKTTGQAKGKLPDMTAQGTSHGAGSQDKILRPIVLPVNTFYEVTCSHVEDGYRLFSLQIKQKETELRKLMNDLAQTPLQQLQNLPKLGMACIVRHEKTNRLYRGVITNIMPSSCVVYFVDFGNTENVACGNMFDIPTHFLRYKMFSIKSTLANCDELGDTYALKDFFQQLILRKELNMKVMPSQGSSFVLCCELFINSISVMDELKHIQMFGLQYQPSVRLSADFQGPVIVRYVDSPKKFYVQLVSNISEHDSLMDKLSIYCQKKGKPLSDIKPGVLCSVSVDNDVDWYRGKVVAFKGMDKKISVRLVDYGKIIDVPATSLREIGYQFTQMPPQVYECCIKCFENVTEMSESAASAFEMYLEDRDGERKILKMHIVDFLTDETLLVNLFDESQVPPVNISKCLGRSQLPYKDYLNIFEKKAPNTFRKRECFSRNDVVGDDQGADVDTYQKPDERSSSWDNGNTTPERAVDGERVKSGPKDFDDRRQGFKGGDKRNNNNTNFGEKPKRQFTENPKGFERRDNQPRDGKPHERGDRGDRGSDRANDRMDRGGDRNDRGGDRGPRKNFKGAKEAPRPYQANDHAETTDKDWNASSAHDLKTVDSMSLSSTDYKQSDVTFDVEAAVSFTYWMDPEEFYVQLAAHQTEYEAMMKEIQELYAGKRPIGATRYENGWCVIARNSRDELLYRAKVCDYNKKLNKYKVLFVDRGYRGVVTPDLMWPISERFLKLPAMAIKCSLANNVVLDFERQDIFCQINNYVNDTMKITCKFNELVNGVYMVTVKVERGDLLEALSMDGLVKMPQDEVSSVLIEPVIVQLDLLVGQTIRVKIVDVESLESFQVCFEHSNITAHAAYFDPKYAKVLVDDPTEQLKKLKGTFCKVHVVDVGADEILRLKILSRAFLEEAPFICPPAIFQGNFAAMIAFVESVNVIHVQKSEFSELLSQQINEMYSHYESDTSSALPFDVAPKKTYAVKSSDGNWYRGEVVTMSGDEVTVKYIDYGNKEVVKVDCLRNLTGNFSQPSSYAMRIFLNLERMDGGDSVEEVVNELSSMIVNIVPMIAIRKKYRGELVADLCANGCSVADELQKKRLAREADVDDICRMIDATKEIDGVADVKKAVFVTHIVNPTDFYLQRSEDVEEIDKLQDAIQIVGESLQPLVDAQAGNLCLGKYSIDGLWYRAKILDYADDMITVHYIDYGNMDVITDKLSLREISDGFTNIQPYAKHCALPLIPKDHQDDWSEKAVGVMQQLFGDIEMECVMISEGSDLSYIHLFTKQGVSAEEILLKKGWAERLSIIKPHSVGFVSHINSLTDFYIQLEEDTSDLEFISDSLIEMESNGENLTSFEEGKMYAALFPEDNSWYRAKLLHSTADGHEVFFVDFGNTAITNSIKELPEKIAELPILVRKCSLEAHPNGQQWSEEAEKKFVELAKDGITCFEIIPLAPGEITTVRLMLEKGNVAEMLQKTEKEEQQSAVEEEIFATVSHINSPGDFYLHLSTKSKELDQMLNHLENPSFNRATGKEKDKICAATFSTDGCVYRAKIEGHEEEDKYKVFFIDYGNSTVTSDIWELSQEIQTIEPLAVKCSLEKTSSSDWTCEQRKRFVELARGGEENFRVIFVDRSSSPAIVKLLIGGQEISLDDAPPALQMNGITNDSQEDEMSEEITSESRKIVEEIVENGMDRRDMQCLTEEIVALSTVRADVQQITEEIVDLCISRNEEAEEEEIKGPNEASTRILDEMPSFEANGSAEGSDAAKLVIDSGTSTQSHTSGASGDDI